jgi:hypothetical protein
VTDELKLEKAASSIVNGSWAPSAQTVQVSIALSLKRIADFLEAVKAEERAKRTAL